MAKYLYGAAVQGIQGFIFRTDKLREIVGASELVESICTNFFRKKVGSFLEEKLIIGAAGNIKYLFENKAECEQVVLTFPKEVMSFAPGITISQAVVEIEGSLTIDHINQLEDLLRSQRNKQVAMLDTGLLITERSRRTGFAAIGYEKSAAIDAGTRAKLDMVNEAHNELKPQSKIALDARFRLPYDMEEMVRNNERSWIAVIHADGNSLGKVLQTFGQQLKNKTEQEIVTAYKTFSSELDRCTINATNIAIQQVLKGEKGDGNSSFLPMRPIVLGGDDLTMIVRAEYALSFTHEFLRAFEAETHHKMSSLFKKYKVDLNDLTACAGIAFIKSSYPFHYGYRLAEELCGEAKKVAKKKSATRVPSCLMFYKVQSSFIGNYQELVKQEQSCLDGLSFSFGPYFLNEVDGPAIDWLQKKARELTKPGAPSAQIRRWLTERYKSGERAAELMKRTIQVLELDPLRRRYVESFNLANPEQDNRSPLYDIVSMASLLKN